MKAPDDNLKRAAPNWSAFYEQLGFTGPRLLVVESPGILELVEFEARASDSYWSDSLEATLIALWDEDPEKAVWETVKEWRLNVINSLNDILGQDSFVPRDVFNITKRQRFEMLQAADTIGLKRSKELIDDLVAAAYEPDEETAKAAVTGLLIQGVIEPYEKNSEGMLIRAIGIPWRKIINHLGNNWGLAFQITSRQWEELIAAAFHEAKYDEVILTPRSADHGRDVIAIKKGVGSVRIINSIKAYKPGNLVRYDDIRALAGVLLGDQKASKGIITTTSDFPPNIHDDPYIAPLMPYRLELMNGSKLNRWLADIAKQPVL